MSRESLAGHLARRNYRGLLSERPALRALVAYAAGIAFANLLPISTLIVLFPAILLFLVALVSHLRKQDRISTILTLLALVLAGMVQYSAATSGFPPTHVKKIAQAGGSVQIVGEIVEEPDVRADRTYLVIEVDSVMWRRRLLDSSGRIIVKIKEPSAAFSFRSRVSFRGDLFVPGGAHIPGGFNYARYLELRGIFGMVVVTRAAAIEMADRPRESWPNVSIAQNIEAVFVNRIVLPVRDALLEAYWKHLPPDHASLLAGFVLGEKRNIPDDVARLFRDTGTFHLMAVSGSNVAVVTGFFLLALYPLNRRIRLAATLAAIVFFSYLTRNEPSVMRASVMAAVGLVGYYRRGDADPVGLLGFAALVLLVLNPLWLFNVGFQLSVAACAGIVLIVPKVIKAQGPAKSTRKAGSWLLVTLLATLSAQLAVLPLMAQYFHRVPVVGLLANFPMIIMAGILTIAGLVFLPVSLLGDAVAAVYAWPIQALISAVFPLLGFFRKLPLAAVSASPPGVWEVGLYYLGLYLILELLWGRRLSIKTTILFLFLLVGQVWTTYLKGPAGESLTFVDCGSDRAVLYVSPEGKRYLWYDSHTEKDQFEQTLLPYLQRAGIDRIDTLITNDRASGSELENEIEIGGTLTIRDMLSHSLAQGYACLREPVTEWNLNGRVKLVSAQTDNATEPSEGGYYYRIRTSAGECTLAGGLSKWAVTRLGKIGMIVELPWSVQPYGAVFESLKESRPCLVVFSPDADRFPAVYEREKLTYMNERTRATTIDGTFRVRFADGRVDVDYMSER